MSIWRPHPSVTLAVVLVACLGCPDGASEPGDAGIVTDTAWGEGGDGVVRDVGSPDGMADATFLPDDADAYVPRQGGYLYPCAENVDCHSGFCIPGPDGTVCTRTCVDSCDVPGWSCRQDVSAVGVLFLCQPDYPTLCDPCRSNDDCVTATDHTPHRCVPVGDAGAFCGAVCNQDADCPESYRCSTVVDIDGVVSTQCVTAGGAECRCSASATARGASTACSVTAGGGSCAGQRSCQDPGGLSACDAPTPGPEICNGVDDNCNDLIDETFESQPCPQTNAFGTCAGVTVCDGAEGERCNAPTPAEEICDGVDNDCDGVTDPVGTPGCTDYTLDADGDGYGLAGDSRCLCAPTPPYTGTQVGDCDDAKKQVNPGATEACNGLDDDCDGQTDAGTVSGCIHYYADGDGDGFGDPADGRCLCAPAAPWVTTDNTDCAPGEGGVSPAAPEVCDGVDNDCDGSTDEDGAGGCVLHFADVDGDTYGNTQDFRCLCAAADPYVVTQGGDCNDGDAALNPGLGEVCGDGIDNDCDGAIDEPNAAGCVVYYRDDDGDGFGIIGDARCLCAPADPYDATEAGDCDDGAAEVKPGAAETCDGADNDCDGLVDEPDTPGCTDYYLDSDGDTFGTGQPTCLCAPLGAFTALASGDCDDTDPSANPNRPELCNGKDDNCDTHVDEPDAAGCSTFFTDVDHDTFGVAGTGICLCGPTGDATATVPGDCNDALAAVNPHAVEVCDAVDNDCDGSVDEGCGLPTLGWPTAGYDARRTGHTMLADVPEAAPTVRWQTALPQGGWSVRNSPVVTPGGDIVVSAGDGVYRLAAADGAITGSATLPATIYPYAGPTLRIGGTVVVGAGTHLLMLTPALDVLWDTDLGATLVSTPIVDPNGTIYVVSASALHRVGPDGAQDWAEPVTNDADTPSHPAIGINGRVYFTASDHTVYAFDPSQPPGNRQRFAAQPAGGPVGEPVHGSVVLSEIATIYAALGDTLYGLSIAGTTVFTRDLNVTTRAGLAIHNTGFVCCNPVEYVWTSGAGNAPLYRSAIDLAAAGQTGDVAKSATDRTSTPVFDRDGDVIVGSSSGIRAFLQNQAVKWSFAPAGVGAVEGPVAIDQGAVIFGDSNGLIYYGE